VFQVRSTPYFDDLRNWNSIHPGKFAHACPVEVRPGRLLDGYLAMYPRRGLLGISLIGISRTFDVEYGLGGDLTEAVTVDRICKVFVDAGAFLRRSLWRTPWCRLNAPERSDALAARVLQICNLAARLVITVTHPI